MAEKEYIEREALRNELLKISICTDDLYGMGILEGLDRATRRVNNAPAADVAPVVHGEWIPSPDGINPIKCRRCGTVAPYRLESDSNHDIGLYPYKSNYCPHCGAKMKGE